MFLDNNGNELFSRNLSEYIDQSYRVEYVDNELVISGLSEGASDFKVIKMSLDGTIIWHYSYGGENEEHCFGMDVNDNGDIFLAGHTTSETDNWDTYTIKINNDGELLWDRTVGNPRGFNPEFIHDEAWGIKATNDGGCVTIAGTGDEYDEYSECNGDDCSDIWNAYLIKFNNDGDVNWQKTFSSNDVSEETYDWAGEAIDLTNDGGAIIAIDNGQFGFLRLNNIQNMLFNEFEIETPIFFRISDNYPNPFNPITNLKYELSNHSFVNLTVYDIMGNEIRNLVNASQSSGHKSIQWDATNNIGETMPSGFYIYKIQVNDLFETKKMVLLK